jgi:WD40 repeat protein
MYTAIPVSILNIHTGEGRLIGTAVNINSLAWSPVGTQLAITTDEYMTSDAYRSTVQIWDAATGDVVAELDNGEAWIIMYYWHSPVWSPDGTHVAVSNLSGDLAVWDVAHQEKVFEVWGFTANYSRYQVAWSPSGELIAASDGSIVRTWNATTGEPISSFTGPTFNLRWVNENQLARVEHDHVSLIDPISGRVSGTLKSELASISCQDSWERCIVWSPNGDYAALANNQAIQILSLTYAAAPDSPPMTLALVDPEKPLPTLPDPAEPITVTNANQITLLGQLGRDDIRDAMWSPDGRTIALLGTHGVWLYDDPALTQPPRLLAISNGVIDGMTFGPDSRYLLLAVQNDARGDYGIRLWDLQSQTVSRVLDGHTGPVRAMSFSADGSLLATGSADYTIRLWKMDTGEQIRVLWDHVDDVWSVDFSPDGSLLASAGDSMLRVWDVRTGDRIARYDGYTEYVKGETHVLNARFAPDGSAVFFFHYNQLQSNIGVRRWFLDDDLRQSSSYAFSGTNFVGVGPRYEIVFSPDGSMMVPYAIDGSYLKLLDVDTGEKIDDWRLLDCVLGSGAVAFSPDGQTLATGVTDNFLCDPAPVSEPRTIWLWDV